MAAQSQIDRKHSASRALLEWTDRMKDGAAILQHSLEVLSNKTTTQLGKKITIVKCAFSIAVSKGSIGTFGSSMLS